MRNIKEITEQAQYMMQRRVTLFRVKIASALSRTKSRSETNDYKKNIQREARIKVLKWVLDLIESDLRRD
jgi:hypothetical protein